MKEVIVYKKKLKEFSGIIFSGIFFLASLYFFVSLVRIDNLTKTFPILIILTLSGVTFLFLLYIQFLIFQRGFGFANLKIQREGLATLQLGLINWNFISRAGKVEKNGYINIKIYINDKELLMSSKKNKYPDAVVEAIGMGYIEIMMRDSKMDIDDVISIINENLFIKEQK